MKYGNSILLLLLLLSAIPRTFACSIAGGCVYPVGAQSQPPAISLPNLNGYAITSGFFSAANPTHAGVDLANGMSGGDVRAIADGLVVDRRETNTGFGWALVIEHRLVTSGVVHSIYGHMQANSLTVAIGDKVTKGQQIGKVGATGYVLPSAHPEHLHFSIRNINGFGCGYVPSSLPQCANDVQQNYRQPLDFIGSSSTKFAFVANGSTNDVWSYIVDQNDGTLSPVINPLTGRPGFASTGIGPISVSADPSGRFVYVANLGVSPSPGSVSGYSVNSNTGVLTPIPGTPISAGPGTISVVVHPNGKFLYAGNQAGSVSAYSVDSSTGALTPILGSPFASKPGGFVAVDPAGRFLFTSGGSAFTIDSNNGVLASIPGSPFPGVAPWQVTVDPTGKFLYGANLGGSISVHDVDPVTGALTPVPGSPFPAQLATFSLAADPSDMFLYAANAHPSDSISIYSINPSTGALTSSGSPLSTGPIPVFVTVDSTGSFLYVARFGILGYRIDSASGLLTPINGSPFPAGGQPLSITLTKGNP